MRDSLIISLKNYSYLKNHDLSSNLFTFFILIAKEFYEFKNYKEIIINSNSNDKEWINITKNEVNSLIKNGI